MTAIARRLPAGRGRERKERFMTRCRTIGVLAALFAIAAAVAGCGDDDDNNGDNNPVAPGEDFDRVYVQIERLGNPLTSEVFIAKREHGHHNAAEPKDDAANFTDDLEGFVTAFGRPQSLADGISGALLPDMLIVRTSGNPSALPFGWLSWALDNTGYGGRKLTDDVVDIGLSAVFGAALGDTTGQIPSLTSDNVDANDNAFEAGFPYLADAN
jgi:hypothetical protein